MLLSLMKVRLATASRSKIAKSLTSCLSKRLFLLRFLF